MYVNHFEDFKVLFANTSLIFSIHFKIAHKSGFLEEDIICILVQHIKWLGATESNHPRCQIVFQSEQEYVVIM